MIYKETHFNVLDNSGIKTVKYIGSHKNQKGTNLGNIITVSVKKLRKKKKGKIINKKVFLAVIAQKKNKTKRKNGDYIQFNKNSVILVDTEYKPIGTRILGTIPNELKQVKFNKIISLATKII